MIISYENNIGGFIRTASEKRIICYGAGCVGASAEDVLEKWGLGKNVCCFIDRNEGLNGTFVSLYGKSVPIFGVNELCLMNLTNKVMLLTLEDFEAVISALNEYKELDGLECFIYPVLNRSYAESVISTDEFCINGHKNLSDISRIPKVMHYCWFGGGEMPEFMQRCVESWKATNPDYEIVRWDEGNFDVYQNNYVKQAYKAGKYAFVSDFARLDALYRQGGIYLDTDVMVLKSFDSLLYNEAFISYNEWPILNSAVSGSVCGNDIIRSMRDVPRSTIDFINNDGSYNKTINSVYETNILSRLGFCKDFTYQLVSGVAVYPPCFFPQKGRLGLNAKVDERTYAVHYATGTWMD